MFVSKKEGLAALVVLSALSAASTVHASQWLMLKYKGHFAVPIPKASLDGIETPQFQYGNDIKLKLNGLGKTSTVYYQVQRWQDGVFVDHGNWGCATIADLNANNEQLVFAQASGRYKVKVVAAMLEKACPTGTISNPKTTANLVESPVYTSAPFVLINQESLVPSADEVYLRQDEYTDSNGVKTLYDLNLKWPKVDGVESYQLTLYKDNTPYEFTLTAAQYDQTLASLGFYKIEDEWDESVWEFTPYTGFGDYRFSVKYCYDGICSKGVGYNQTETIAPIVPRVFMADSYDTAGQSFSRGLVRLRWTADRRTLHFKLHEDYARSTLPGELEDSFPNDSYSMTASSDGSEFHYEQFIPRSVAGTYNYKMKSCTPDQTSCSDDWRVSVPFNTYISINEGEPSGVLDTYQVGDTAITGYAFDADGNDGQTYIRLHAGIAGSYEVLLTPTPILANGTNPNIGSNHGFTINNIESLLVNAGVDTNAPFSIWLTVQDIGQRYETWVTDGTQEITHFYNRAPVAVDDVATTTIGQQLTINVLSNDSDPENQPLTVQIKSQPAWGSVSVNGQNQVVYNVPSTEPGEEQYSFTYGVTDSMGESSTTDATVTVNVSDYNYAPTLSTIAAATIDEDSATPALTFTVADRNNGTGLLTLSATSSNTALVDTHSISFGGSGANRTVTVAPKSNAYGSAAITVRVSDGDKSAQRTFNVTVNPINDAPTITGVPTGAVQDQAFVFKPNINDVDGDAMTLSIANNPAWLSYDAANKQFVGTPTNVDVGTTNNVIVSVSDGQATTQLAPFNLEVKNVNDAPKIGGTPTASVDEDNAYSFTPAFSDDDTNPADTLTFEATGLPAWLSLNTSTGELSGTPGNDDTGTTGPIVLTIFDQFVRTSLPAFTITVNPVNDAPTITGTPATSVNEDTAYSFVPVGSDVDNGNLTYNISNKPTWATFNSQTGELSGTPDNSHVGSTSGIVISVSDGSLSAALPAFDLQVVNVNDLPIAQNGSFSTNEDTAVTIDLNTLVSDDDANSVLTIELLSAAMAQNGQLTVDPVFSGRYTYTPNANYHGSDSFSYQVKDETGAYSANGGTVSLTINSVNDAPTGSLVISGTAEQNQTLTANQSIDDADGVGAISYQWKRSDTAISGATSETYLLIADDVGHTITVTASYTDGGGHLETMTSAATAVVLESIETPNKPSFVKAPGSFTVKWNAVGNAANYKVQWANCATDCDSLTDSDWQTISPDPTANELVQTGKAPATYAYRVAACLAGGRCSDYSEKGVLFVVERRVIFVHTDTLGTPILETDTQGNSY